VRVLVQQRVITAGFAVVFTLLCGSALRVAEHASTIQWMVALALTTAAIASFHFPVHVASHMKLHPTAPALFIAVVTLPPLLAALVAVAVAVGGNISVRQRTKLSFQDIANEALRWGTGSAAAGIVFQVLPRAAEPAALLAAGLVMYAIDVCSITLLVGTLDDRSLRSILYDAVDNWRFEGALYLTGALGAIGASSQWWALILLLVPSGIIYKAVQNSYQVSAGTRRLIESLADTVDMRDAYTPGHSTRVADYARIMASSLERKGKIGPLQVDLIVAAARVHDVGKIEIPDAILWKRGDLLPHEREIVESHAERGAEILRCYPNFRLGVPLVRHHHERWDGTGYPHRLARFDIPLGARVIAVADSYDAMTSDKTFGPGLSRERAAMILRRGRGQQWDPEVVDILLSELGLAASPLLRVVPESPALHPGEETA